MMKSYLLPQLLVAVAVLGASAVVYSEDSTWPTLNRQVAELHIAGRDAEALPVAQKALETAEKKYGPSSPETSLSLNNLALIYKNQGDLEKAATLYKRSLSIAEILVSPDDPDLLVAFNNLAMTYEAMGKYAEADAIYEDVRQRGHTDWAGQMKTRSKMMRQKSGSSG